MAAGDVSDALVDRVRAHVGQPSQNGILTVDIFKFLNLAQSNLVRRLNDNAMPELCAIASGTLTASRVGLPSDFMRERFVEVGASNIRARQWDISELDALDNNTLTVPSTTNPYYFIWYNATDAALRLQVELNVPASTSAYKLHYVKQPADMTTSVDPVLGVEKHGLLVEFALWLAWHQIGEAEEAERHWALYVEGINRVNARHRFGGRRNEGKPGDIG